jgi:hypothetical protein
MIKQQLEAINKQNDIGKLRASVAQAESNMERVPPQAKPAVEYLMQKMNERIKQLEEESSKKPNDSSNPGGGK